MKIYQLLICSEHKEKVVEILSQHMTEKAFECKDAGSVKVVEFDYTKKEAVLTALEEAYPEYNLKRYQNSRLATLLVKKVLSKSADEGLSSDIAQAA